MNYHFQELEFLSDLEAVFHNNQADNCIILKLITKLIFSVLEQISKLPFVLTDIKKEFCNNKCYIDEMFNKNISILQDNLHINEMQQTLERIEKEQETLKQSILQIQDEIKTTNNEYATKLTNIQDQIANIEEKQQNMLNMKDFNF